MARRKQSILYRRNGEIKMRVVKDSSQSHRLIERTAKFETDRAIEINLRRKLDHQFSPKLFCDEDPDFMNKQFLEVKAEVPKFWRGDRIFFSPGRIQLHWLHEDIVGNTFESFGTFKPHLPHSKYFELVDEIEEPMPFSDNGEWCRRFQGPRRGNFNSEVLEAIKEISNTPQFITLRILVPDELDHVAWCTNPHQLTLRYGGGGLKNDIMMHYTTRDLHNEFILFTLSKADCDRLAELPPLEAPGTCSNYVEAI
jgi:hypothetical protein